MATHTGAEAFEQEADLVKQTEEVTMSETRRTSAASVSASMGCGVRGQWLWNECVGFSVAVDDYEATYIWHLEVLETPRLVNRDDV